MKYTLVALFTFCMFMSAQAQEINAAAYTAEEQRNIEIKLVTLGSVLDEFDTEVTRQLDILTTRQQGFDACATTGALYDGTECVAQEGIASNTTMYDACVPSDYLINTYVPSADERQLVILCHDISGGVLPRIHYNVAGPDQCNNNTSDWYNGGYNNRESARIFAFCKPMEGTLPYDDMFDTENYYPQTVVAQPTNNSNLVCTNYNRFGVCTAWGPDENQGYQGR